ncbi:hypothetical protein DQ04_04921030 [Trypanosoma grayi]|uniref:hypothetical protein n=1 Tax=Trypanosoma grayi TaxID=71804 RepID=UPI0004F4B493|nr:hypothetical protein DQ04_04921030 [Trypanosoma grayi]KEG09628.1 hypothetical protein DQ04_04921030 [Trypanosoma grayi]
MHVIGSAAAAPPSFKGESVIAIGDFSPAPLSDVASAASSGSFNPEEVTWCAYPRDNGRPSPSRPPPLPPTSSAASTVSGTCDATDVDAAALQDTTALSDLSVEIQKVEARLAAIREEEARLQPKRAAPTAPARSSGRYSSVLNLHSVNVESRGESTTVVTSDNSSSQIGRRGDAGVALTTLANAAHGCPSHIRTANLLSPPKRRSGRAHRTNITQKDMPDPTAVLSSETECVPTVPTDRTRELPMEAVMPSAPPSGVVFSLTAFLRPLRTVDIEIAAGVYEKLDIFVGEDMSDVARRFIAKHKLDPERAFKPLHTFLLSLIVKDKSEEHVAPCDKVTASPRGHGTMLIKSTSAGGNWQVQPVALEAPQRKSAAETNDNRCSALGRRTVAHVPQQSARGNPNRKVQRLNAAHDDHSGVNKMLEYSAEKSRPKCSARSIKDSIHHQHTQGKATTVDAGGCNNAPIVKCGSRSQNSRRVDPVAMGDVVKDARTLTSSCKNTNHPKVVAVEAENVKPTVTRTRSVPRSQPSCRLSERTTRCRSAELRRTASSTRTHRHSLQEEEPVPTFKPCLAPRSELLAAQDAKRQQGPAYARLYARTTNLSTAPAISAVAAECTGKPRILPHKRPASLQEPVGERLYEQAIEQKQRLQEKRLKEKEQREEEERRSLMAAPQINKERRWRRLRDGDNPQAHSATAASPSLLKRQQNPPTVKTREEREFEACTFAPVVNPASIRMFNMVVQGQNSEEHQVNKGNVGGKEKGQAPSARSRTLSNEGSRDVASVEDRLLLLEQKRRKRLDEERRFRETVDAATGRPLFQPFLGR